MIIKIYLFKNQIILKSQQRFKSEAHCAYTEEVNTITLSGNDDKSYILLIELEHTHMEQMLLKYVKVGTNNKKYLKNNVNEKYRRN